MATRERAECEPDSEQGSAFETLVVELEALAKRLLQQHRLELEAVRGRPVERELPGHGFAHEVSHGMCASEDDVPLAEKGGTYVVEWSLDSPGRAGRSSRNEDPAGSVRPPSQEPVRSSPRGNFQTSRDSCESQHDVGRARSECSRDNAPWGAGSSPDLQDGQARRSEPRRQTTSKGLRVVARKAALTCASPSNDLLKRVEDQVARGSSLRRRHTRSLSLPTLPGYRERLLDFIEFLVKESAGFENIIRAIIILNAVYIGVEIQWSLDGVPPSWFLHLEHCFLAAFILELGLRFAAEGRGCFNNYWFLFDLSVVLLGAVSTWILEPIVMALADGHPLGYQLTAVRTLRLLRLVRLFRLSKHFRELRQLCRGLAQAGRAALSATLLVSLAIYIFACVSVEAITREYADDPMIGDIVTRQFRSLPITMLTLMQFATADSLTEIYVPVILRAPSLSIYFMTVWLVVTVLIMNLVTGVIVERAIGQASQDRELRNKEVRKQLRRMIPQIEAVFDKLDACKAGEIWLEDIDLAVVPLPEGLRDVIQEEALTDLFGFSLDGSGTVKKSDFVEAVTLLAYSEVPVETTQMLHLLRHIQGKVLDLEACSVNAQEDKGGPGVSRPQAGEAENPKRICSRTAHR